MLFLLPAVPFSVFFQLDNFCSFFGLGSETFSESFIHLLKMNSTTYNRKPYHWLTEIRVCVITSPELGILEWCGTQQCHQSPRVFFFFFFFGRVIFCSSHITDGCCTYVPSSNGEAGTREERQKSFLLEKLCLCFRILNFPSENPLQKLQPPEWRHLGTPSCKGN